MRSRSYYKNQVKSKNGRKPVDGKRVSMDPQLIVDLIEVSRNLDDRIRNWNLEDGVNWMLGFNSYVKDKTGTLHVKYSNSHIFKRGEIVLVDFFGHFGTELTYEHPAIVLADNFDGLVIAPISSPCYKDSNNRHVDLQKNIPDLGDLPNNCGIKLEQIRFISKKRVLNKFNRVSNTNKLNEIDEVLMKTLTPYSYQQLIMNQRNLQSELDNKNMELIEKEKEIENLKLEIEHLKPQHQEK